MSDISVLQVVSTSARSPSDQGGITGPERRALNLSAQWQDRGIKVTVLYPQHGPLWSEFNEAGIETRPFHLSGKLSVLKAVLSLTKEIYRSEAEVIHSQGAAALDLAVVIAANLCGIRSVITRPVMIEDLITRSMLSRWLFGLIDKAVTLRFASIVVAVSQNGEERLRDNVASECLQLIWNGVPDIAGDVVEQRRHQGLSVGMVGHLRDYKCFSDFLRVAEVCLSHDSSMQFHIVGDGPERDNLIRMATDLNIANNVTFHGLLGDVSLVLSELDLFLFTSLREGLSVAILEAMSFSLPIIATDVGGIRDQVTDGFNGFIYPIHDIDNMSLKIIEISKDRKLLINMGINSRARYSDRFAQTTMLQRYTDLYVKLAAEN